jgi:hypothetical protein
VAAWLGTRKVRHLGVIQQGGGWVPLCARPWKALTDDLLWLGPTDHSADLTDGNHRRKYRARLAHPVCTRCMRDFRDMRKLLEAELAALRTNELLGDLSLFTGKPVPRLAGDLLEVDTAPESLGDAIGRRYTSHAGDGQ